ncbi:hypothetical protein Scep_009372 [Stephania cephalantha]|uniref:Uncharacterized protein n=1 Tax=Stephania cephalantha TaxID=152367 RepID=A0AAP0PG75_9MAGN
MTTMMKSGDIDGDDDESGEEDEVAVKGVWGWFAQRRDERDGFARMTQLCNSNHRLDVAICVIELLPPECKQRLAGGEQRPVILLCNQRNASSDREARVQPAPDGSVHDMTTAAASALAAM